MDPWLKSVMNHHKRPQNNDFNSSPANLTTSLTEDNIATACSFVKTAAELLIDIKFKTTLPKLQNLYDTSLYISWFLQDFTVKSDRLILFEDSKYFPYCSTPMPIEHYWHKALSQAKSLVEHEKINCSGIYEDNPTFFKKVEEIKVEEIDLISGGVSLMNKALDHISNNRKNDAVNCYVEASKLFEKANAKHLLKKCEHQLKRLELNEDRPCEHGIAKDYCFSYPAKTVTSDKPTNKGKISQEYLNERFDRNLFENLRSLRKKLADKEGNPPFCIFYDLSLKAMATYFPKDLQSLRNIEGVDEKNLRKYGELFIKEIVEYCEQLGCA